MSIRDFNPRSPCGERLPSFETPSALMYFNPRSPCGERLSGRKPAQRCPGISIHAPRVGSDRIREYYYSGRETFQSTLPVWGATGYEATQRQRWLISIHAPRVGSDSLQLRITGGLKNISIHAPRVGSDIFQIICVILRIGYFNPRSPCGERPHKRFNK